MEKIVITGLLLFVFKIANCQVIELRGTGDFSYYKFEVHHAINFEKNDSDENRSLKQAIEIIEQKLNSPVMALTYLKKLGFKIHSFQAYRVSPGLEETASTNDWISGTNDVHCVIYLLEKE